MNTQGDREGVDYKSTQQGFPVNRRLVIIFLFAVVIASGYTFFAYRMIGSKLVSAHAAKTTRVVTAARDIKLGSLLYASDLATVSMADPLPKGVVLDPSTLIGRGAISDLYQGEPILQSRLAAPGSGGGMAATIPLGMRACAIKVDEVVGVAGFVTPGMRVDVLVSGNPPGAQNASQGTMTKTILQNIQVLSAGTDIQKDAEGKPQQVQVVNLLVSPEQAESLSLASNQVKLQLVLRNPLDTTVNQTSGTAMSTLFGQTHISAALPQPVVKQVHRTVATTDAFSVDVFNGSKISKQNVTSSWGKQ